MTPKVPPNCGKCGLCLNVCPVYKQMKEEQASPRARMQLIRAHKNQTIASSPYLKEIMSKCLMCGSCTANCPSGIDHYSAFMKMREQMAEDHGEPAAVKSLIYLLARDYRTRWGSTLARTGQKLLPKKIAESYKLGNIALKNMPRLNAVPFRNTCEEIILPDTQKPDRQKPDTPKTDTKWQNIQRQGSDKETGTVAYFTGCATNYIYDDVGLATVGILKRMGYKIIIPKNQTCCSIPLLFHGAKKQAQKNIETNIEALKGLKVDAILVDCSTCGEALKHIYPSFFNKNDPASHHAIAIAQKIGDVLSFIDDHFDRLTFNASPKEKPVVTYHAPCHSKNSFQSHTTIENLIKKLPFVIYKKTCDTEECCGGGGTFFYEFPKVSKEMTDKKINNAKAIHATQWLTDCPVCRMNLSGNLKKEDNLIIKHPLSLIYSALKPL
ncbi:MAG: (Fe-S)-binding protein [Desulfobacula sp.]|nr:(Fe-S)-binding protein [Desulfobacula sp.]